ncbi:MAG: SDR family oxidoreductase [Chloroflexi bacterium]|nr:SDR family oxidoreductase [Chloroflexota bacterium]
MLLQDKVALVTGGGSGIGRAIALRFAAEGAHVVVNDLTIASAQETVEAFAAGARPGLAVAADVADSAQVRAMFERVAAERGRLDVLVNNAGIAIAPGQTSAVDDITAVSDQAWQRMVGVHMDGAFYCTREAVRAMRAGGAGGAIVNMSSVAALAGFGPVHYAAAKGGLLGFTRALARELGPEGIRVNAICPGFIDTPMTAPIPEPERAHYAAETPLRRFGRPEEIAATAAYLASEESSFVTGQWLSPNGGFVTV